MSEAARPAIGKSGDGVESGRSALVEPLCVVECRVELELVAELPGELREPTRYSSSPGASPNSSAAMTSW